MVSLAPLKCHPYSGAVTMLGSTRAQSLQRWCDDTGGHGPRSTSWTDRGGRTEGPAWVWPGPVPVGEVRSLNSVPWPFLPQTSSSCPLPVGQETAPRHWFLSAAFSPLSEKPHFPLIRTTLDSVSPQSGQAAGEEPTNCWLIYQNLCFKNGWKPTASL